MWRDVENDLPHPVPEATPAARTWGYAVRATVGDRTPLSPETRCCCTRTRGNQTNTIDSVEFARSPTLTSLRKARRTSAVGILIVLAFLAAACGTRLDEDDVRAAQSERTGADLRPHRPGRGDGNNRWRYTAQPSGEGRCSQCRGR